MFNLLGKMFMNLGSQPIRSVPISNHIQMQSEYIELQIQDITGNWRTYHATQNVPAMIVSGMQQLAVQHPDHRVRAINSNGRVVDIL
jgi:hypothetical protein